MSAVLILSILLAAAVLSAVWFWYGCRRYEEEIIYLEDIILQVDDTLSTATANGGMYWNEATNAMIREEALLIREWRQEDSGRD